MKIAALKVRQLGVLIRWQVWAIGALWGCTNN